MLDNYYSRFLFFSQRACMAWVKAFEVVLGGLVFYEFGKIKLYFKLYSFEKYGDINIIDSLEISY